MTSLVLVTGPPGGGKATLAVPPTRLLGPPLVSKDVGAVAGWVSAQRGAG
jgi:hypothetical protein